MSDGPIIPKVWITKFLFTRGIYCVFNVEDCGDRMISKRLDHTTYYHGTEWHLTREAAFAQAQKMISAKRHALQKSRQNLEALGHLLAEPHYNPPEHEQ